MAFPTAATIGLRALAVPFLACACLWAQAAGPEELPGIDLTKLSAPQKASALKILRAQGCSCGCTMKVAECRVKDPDCSYSRGLANTVVDVLKKGGTEEEAIKAAAASSFAHPPGASSKVLEDPVTIAVAGAPVLGPKDAPVTLVEFSDFQCPYCVAAVPQLQAVLKEFPTQVKLIFKQYPLDNHSQAAFAATAALAAHRQGKFWAMHDSLFAHHQNLSRENVLALAKDLGLNMQRFESDLASPEIAQTVQHDIAEGDRVGVPGTPTLYIDGQRFNGPLTLDTLKPVLDAELKHGEAKTASSMPAAVRSTR